MKSYKQVNRGGVEVREHREVWEAANGQIPEGLAVDHINGDIHDNRLENLRLATKKQNAHNSKRPRNNKTGLKGLSWDSVREGWRGTVVVDQRQRSFRSLDLLETCCWIIATRKHLHGEFARIN